MQSDSALAGGSANCVAVRSAPNNGTVATDTADGWCARLTLDFIKCTDKTELRREHTGPLVVQRPLYPEGEVCHAYLLHPPGGIVGGDQLTLNAGAHPGASALITTPGACKFYRSDGKPGIQHQNLSVASQADLEWFPQENIYFDGCVASQNTQISLAADSRFIGWEIHCFGRSTVDTAFQTGVVKTQLEVTVDSRPVLSEHLKINGSEGIERISGLRGATVVGTLMVAAGDRFDKNWPDILRDILSSSDGFAVTCIDGILLLRYLGCDSEQARNGFIAAWKILRPLALQRVATAPRIWAT